MEREQTTIRLPAELKKQVQKQAEKMGISFNELIMSAVNDFLAHQE